MISGRNTWSPNGRIALALVAWVCPTSIAVAVDMHDTREAQVIPYARSAPVLDGRLDDLVWQEVEPFSPFVHAGTKTPVAGEFQTEVKAVFTRKALHFGIECCDPHAPTLKTTAEAHDGPVWNDDAVEIFVNPEDRGFFQLLVSHTGVRADLAYPAERGGGKISWNAEPDWRAKTSAAKGYWTAEVAVPFAALWGWACPPTFGERFRLKICRLIYEKTGNTDDRVCSSWNELPGRVFASNSGWRPALLGDENLIRYTDFLAWTGRRPRQVGISLFLNGVWTLENGSRKEKGVTVGSWEVIRNPEPDIPSALKITRLSLAGQNPRLFVRAPLRPGHAYRFSAKVQSAHHLNLTVNSQPWVRHFMDAFSMPDRGWPRLTKVSRELTVGEDSKGRDAIRFLYLWLDPRAVGAYLLAEPKLVEVQTAEPKCRRDLLNYHGMKSLAESNFGVKPLAQLSFGQDRSYDASRVIYRDTATGFEIWKVTHFIYLDRLLSTGQKSWSADGQYFAFTSQFRPFANNMTMLNADATRVLSIKTRNVAAPGMWAPTGHLYYSMPYTGVYAFDPETREARTVFKLPEDKKFPGRNWIKFQPESMKTMQYAWQFGEKAVIRIWDVESMTYKDIPTKTYSEEPYKAKDWLYGARFKGPHTIVYGMNHQPHLSDNNQPQSWTHDLRTGEYKLNPHLKHEDRGSHGCTSPGGKYLAYFRSGLGYRPQGDQEKIHIGGLGGDGHMAFSYQDRIAVAGDVSDDALVTMIYPDTRNVNVVSYSQNLFTGYYGSIIFVSMSPDVTKLVFTSDMMGYRDLYWGIMNYPMPPVSVRTERADEGVRVRWDEPEWAAETAGYRVYRSDQSGRDYILLSPRPVDGTEYLDTSADTRKTYYYTVRSVERSSLVSRAFSNEAAWNASGRQRRYFEAECFKTQQVPFRIKADSDAVNEKFMLLVPLHEEPKDSVGKLTYDVSIATPGRYRLLARVKRGLGSGADCRLTAQAGGQRLQTLVAAKDWTWKPLAGDVSLPARSVTVTLSGQGLSVDRLLLTTDAAYHPEGKGSDLEVEPIRPPAGLEAAEARHFDIRLRWAAVTHPELHHYQVYRARGERVKPTQEFLVGSPAKPALLDYNLQAGATYSYVITAVDNWGNESRPSQPKVASTEPLVKRLAKEIALVDLTDIDSVAHEVGSGKNAAYAFSSDHDQPAELRIPFTLDAAGEFVTWIHGAARDRQYTELNYRVAGGRRRAYFGAQLHRKGQNPLERIQWTRLTCQGLDAGTVFALKQGDHTLVLTHPRNRKTSLLLDKILVTNDLSYVPPGKRFIP